MRRLALLLGIVAAAVGVWIMASGGEEPAPIGGTPGAETEAGFETPAAERSVEQGTQAVLSPAEGRVEVEPTDQPPGEREIVRVLVTRKDTGEPMPDARVAYFEAFNVNDLSAVEEEVYRRLSRDWEKLTARYGSTVPVDSDGIAFIPLETSVRATGRLGEFYGQLAIRKDPDGSMESEYRLELEQEVALRVQVLDTHGNPAIGVRVDLVPRFSVLGARVSPSELGTTEAPDGIVELAHLQYIFRRRSGLGPSPAGYILRPNVPGLLDGTAIDPHDPPEDLIVFRLPPTGRIVADFRTSTGERMPSEFGGGSVTIGVAPAEPLEDGVRFDPPGDQRWSRRRSPEGPIVFERVVTGRTWVATANPTGEAFQEVFSGPLVEGHEVLLDLAHTWGPYMLVGRVIDESGEPLRSKRLMKEYAIGEGRMGRGGGPLTDERGYFRSDIPGDKSLTADPTLTRFKLDDRETGISYIWEGELTLAAGDNDLGDLEPDQGTLIASGRFLVDGDVPTGQRVHFHAEYAEGRTNGSGMTFGGMDPRLKILHFDDGRFEVRGEPAGSRYLLVSDDPAYLPVIPIEFVQGDELSLELRQGGSLEAAVLIDADVPRSGLQAQLVPRDGQVPEPTKPDPDPRARNRVSRITSRFGDRLVVRFEESPHWPALRWSALWPGRYRFEIQAHGARAPVASIDGVQITSGERNSDLHAEPIDLRGKLRTLEVTVLDLDRKPLDPLEDRVMISVNDSDPRDRRSFNRVNPETILVSDPDVDLVVGAQGYQPKQLSGVRNDIEVMLEPYPRVTIKIASLALPEDVILTVSIRESRDRTQRDDGRLSPSAMVSRPVSSKELTGPGEAVLQVGGDGRYTLTLSVRNEKMFRFATIRDFEPSEIDVSTALGPQVFEIRIPEEVLKKAVEEVGRPR